jgi:hypothetical protein
MQRILTIVGPIPLMALAMLAIGLALGVVILAYPLSPCIADITSWMRFPLMGLIVAASYFVYRPSLLVIAPAINAGRPFETLSRARGLAVGAALIRASHNDAGGALLVSGVRHAVRVCDDVLPPDGHEDRQ